MILGQKEKRGDGEMGKKLLGIAALFTSSPFNLFPFSPPLAKKKVDLPVGAYLMAEGVGFEPTWE